MLRTYTQGPARHVFALSIVFLWTIMLSAQDLFPEYAPVFRDDIIARVDINLPEDSLALIFAPGNEESDYPFHATFVFDNGTIRDTFTDAGFQLRGNTSRYAQKKSFQISLNTYIPGRSWYGLEKINLNGEHNDPTVSRSKICWDLLRDIGVPAPRASHVRLYINGRYYGLYANIEHIDDQFVNSRFGSKSGNLYKCLWPADLVYLGTDPELYKISNSNGRVYELKTNEAADDYSDLAHFIDVLNNTPTNDLPCELEKVFNVNSFLLSMAFDILTGNWDGPLFNKNNFYLYHNPDRDWFEYIPYDLDNTFGIDWFGIDWATRDIYAWGHPDEPRPLYSRIMEVPEYKKRFSFFMNQFMTEVYNETVLFPRLDALEAMLAPAVAEDMYYTLDYGFDTGDFSDGFLMALPYFHTKEGIKPFITRRRTASLQQLQLSDLAPVITAVKQEPTNEPAVNFLTASIEDDQGIGVAKVWFQWAGSAQTDIMTMYDDGIHMDGAADDGRYGVHLPWPDTVSVLTYAIVVNDLNGKEGRYPVCGTNELVLGRSKIKLAINELMASNGTTLTDEQGDYEDWVEIYNYGTDPVFLGDLYLSDNRDNPDQWAFPDIWIDAGTYLLVWADNDPEDGALHTSFKLNADGEYIGIYDSDSRNNALIDGIGFGPLDVDQAWGRLPDGTGEFRLVHATPGSANEAITSTSEEKALMQYVVYPNPVNDLVFLHFASSPSVDDHVVLLNIFGQKILEQPIKETMEFDVHTIPPGNYLLGIKGEKPFTLICRFVKQ